MLDAVPWVVSLLLVQRAGHELPWQQAGQPPDGQKPARGHRRRTTEQAATQKGISTAGAAGVLAAAGLFAINASA